MTNPISHANGTQTATVTTEHSLATAIVAGTFQIVIDISAMLAGDVVEFRTKRKLLSGGSAVSEDVVTFSGAPSADGKAYEGLYFANLNTDAASIEWTLKQTFGTSRAYPWQVFKWT